MILATILLIPNALPGNLASPHQEMDSNSPLLESGLSLVGKQ